MGRVRYCGPCGPRPRCPGEVCRLESHVMDGLEPLTDRSAREILREYPSIRPQEVRYLGGAGGFSGSRFWHVAAAGGAYYGLRRWPTEGPNPARLALIHAVLRHVAVHGFAQVPVPLATRFGGTCIARDGHLWELTPWLPGRADYRQGPSPERLQNALAALAEFHQAAGSFDPARAAGDCDGDSTTKGTARTPAANGAGRPSHGLSPGVAERQQRLRAWLSGAAEDLRRHLAADPLALPRLAPRGRAILDDFARAAAGVVESLDEAAQVSVPLQMCIRDIWHDHVFFEADRVTGIVDFGSMHVECVAGDIARLLGSLVADSPEGWAMGLAAYQSVRPLLPDEERLIGVFDRSTVLLSGLNWLDWLFREKRQFGDLGAVKRRIDEIADRLQHLVGTRPAAAAGPPRHLLQ